MPSLTTRPARVGDLPRLTEIYNHYVLNTASTFDITPRTVEDRKPWFDDHAVRGRHRMLVAVENDRVVGYATTSRFRPKPAYDSTVESSIYLAPEVLGRGLGARLYRDLFEAVAEEEIHRFVAGIAEGNPASIALHHRFGFREIGVFHEVGHKFGRYWNVVWYERPGRLEPRFSSDSRQRPRRGVTLI